jgi:hypothetical protein
MNSSSLTIESGAEGQTDCGIDSNLSPLEPPKPDGLPVPLWALAAYMRDGTWLDIRTEDGPAYRVRIVEIIVRVQSEDIRFMQEWLEHLDDEGHEVKRVRHYINVDSDTIWKVEPSRYHIDQVEPYGLKITMPKALPQDESQMQKVLTTVIKTALTLDDLKLEELRQAYDRHTLPTRKAVMIVAYEMSDLSPPQICQALGYKSQMPHQTARQDVSNSRCRNHVWLRAAALRLGTLCDQQLDFRARRTQPFPTDYRPVLAH